MPAWGKPGTSEQILARRERDGGRLWAWVECEQEILYVSRELLVQILGYWESHLKEGVAWVVEASTRETQMMKTCIHSPNNST